jgi:hypothetical protein
MSTTMRKDQGGNQANQAKEQAGQALDKGREAAGHAGEAVKDAAVAVGQAVAHKAGDVASAIGHKAEDATAAVGSGMQTAADKVREVSPHEGMLGTASKTVADAMDSAGKYVEDRNLSGMMEDVTNLVKRNPIPALLLGLGVGFLIGRLLTPRS